MRKIQGAQLTAAGAFTVALAVHLLLVAAVVILRPSPPAPPESEPFFEVVELLEPSAPPPAIAKVTAPAPAPLPPVVHETLATPAEPFHEPLVPVAAVVQEPAALQLETAVAEPPPSAPLTAAAVAVQAPPAPAVDDYVSPDLSAAYRNNPAPPYPLMAKRRGLEGVVLLAVSLDVHGYPLRVEIKRSSGHGILDETALQSVRKWRFVPAQRGGRAVGAEVEVPLRFALR